MQPKRILLIDDIQSVRDTLRNYLCPPVSAADRMTQLIQQGIMNLVPKFEIDEAGQGAYGVTKARAAFDAGRPFDIAIVDMIMPPGIDGRETIRQLREFDKGIHIIVCTALTESTADELAAVNGGVPPVMLYKPLESPDQLRRLVESAERTSVNGSPAE